ADHAGFRRRPPLAGGGAVPAVLGLGGADPGEGPATDAGGGLSMAGAATMSLNTTLNAWFYRQMAIWAGLLKRDELSLEYWERVRALRPRDADTALTVAHRRAERG